MTVVNGGFLSTGCRFFHRTTYPPLAGAWLFPLLTAKVEQNSALLFVKMLFVQKANWCITSQKGMRHFLLRIGHCDNLVGLHAPPFP